jgi:hypothetical protein
MFSFISVRFGVELGYIFMTNLSEAMVLVIQLIVTPRNYCLMLIMGGACVGIRFISISNKYASHLNRRKHWIMLYGYRVTLIALAVRYLPQWWWWCSL